MPRIILIVLALIGVSADRPMPAVPDPLANLPQVQPGQSMARVRELIGEPERVSRQILFRRHIEQWVYPGSPAPRVEFECMPNAEPRVMVVIRH